jgi:biotin carboxylase
VAAVVGCGLCERLANFLLFQAAQAEAEAAFGNPGLYLEKFIERPAILNFKFWVIVMATSSILVNETVQSNVATRSF